MPSADATSKTVSVLICAACGKVFPYDHAYIVDPAFKAADGGPAVYHGDCYKGPKTPVLRKTMAERLDFLFVSGGDEARVYKVDLEQDKKTRQWKIPMDLVHGRERAEATPDEVSGNE